MCNLLQKVELLHAAGTHFVPPNAQELVQSFYEMMNILDDKGLALLAFDGIIVAATTFAAEKGGVFSRRGLARWLAIVIIFLSLAAAAACLFVSEISYPFYGYVACNGPNNLDFTGEINQLAELIDWRTDYFHFAWYCSIIAIPLFAWMFWVSLNWTRPHVAQGPHSS